MLNDKSLWCGLLGNFWMCVSCSPVPLRSFSWRKEVSPAAGAEPGPLGFASCAANSEQGMGRAGSSEGSGFVPQWELQLPGGSVWTHWNFFSFPLNYIRVPAALTLNAKRLPDFGTEMNVFETSPAWNPYPCFFKEIQFIALSWIEVNCFSVSLGYWVPAPELAAADSEQEPLPGKRRHIPWFPFAEMGAQHCC